MNILLTIETLQPGGAEWFVLRLADALYEAGHRVAIWVLRRDLVDSRLGQRFPHLALRGIRPGLIRQLSQADRLSRKVGVGEPWVHRANVAGLRSFVHSFRPDVIHSHLIKTDRVAGAALAGTGIPLVITVHGDYLNFYHRLPAVRQPDYLEKARAILSRVDRITLISQKQAAFFRDLLKVPEQKLTKIYNGYPAASNLPPVSRNDAGLTFGMVARGIPEKGWAIAIDAFQAAALPTARLMLVGESDYLDTLKAAHRQPNILFRPFTPEPLREIASFDIGLLPSWYGSESLPTTIIEYLALGKPIIASAAGEIQQMIQTDGGPAGVIVPLTDDRAQMTEDVRQAMVRLAGNTALRAEMGRRAVQAFEAFRMDRCRDAYLQLYQNSKQ